MRKGVIKRICVFVMQDTCANMWKYLYEPLRKNVNITFEARMTIRDQITDNIVFHMENDKKGIANCVRTKLNETLVDKS